MTLDEHTVSRWSLGYARATTVVVRSATGNTAGPQ